MRVAQVAPLYESVPPKLYGGTERVVYDLTEELVARGHDVTLFASGDSVTSARLVPAVRQGLWAEPAAHDPIAALFCMQAEVFRRAGEFDIIHTHTDYHAFPYVAGSPTPVVTTLHGRLDVAHYPEVLRAFPKARLISISRSQRAQMPEANWAGTV